MFPLTPIIPSIASIQQANCHENNRKLQRSLHIKRTDSLGSDHYERRRSDTLFGASTNVDRYRHKLREGYKKSLTSFKIQDEIELVKDGKFVKIPRDFLDSPEFRRGSNEASVGQDQGQGQQGDQVGQVGADGQPQPGQGQGQGQGPQQPGPPGDQPGDQPGEGEEAGEGSGGKSEDGLNMMSLLDVYEDLMSRHDFELPFEERGQKNIQRIEYRTNRISRFGTPGRIHPRRSFENAMRRELGTKGDKFSLDKMQFRKTDFRYKDFKEVVIPKENAVIFYVMDTSGSQGKHEKDMARVLNSWLSITVQGMYGKINAELRDEKPQPGDFGDGVDEVYILHESSAEEVSQKEFYNTSKSGGTDFSSAYQLILDKLKDGSYPPDQYNIYVFHYTDGENSYSDNPKAINMLKEMKELGVNRFGYVETLSKGKAITKRGAFTKTLTDAFGQDDPFIRQSAISERDPQSIERVLNDIIGRKKEKPMMLFA